jgi:hypothetical protein
MYIYVLYGQVVKSTSEGGKEKNRDNELYNA